MTGSQTNVGSSNNVPSAAVIKNASNENVTANYNITYANGTLTVTPATLAITAIDQTYTYNGTAQGENNATYTTGLDAKVTVVGLQGSDALTSITLNGQETNAGEYTGKIVPSAAAIGQATGNYTISYTGANLTINRATATVTAVDNSKTYGESDPTLTATVTGLKNGDTESVISYTVTRENGADVGTYTITPSGAAEQGNYNVTYVGGTLTITAKPLTITADGDTKVYDGTALTRSTYTSTALAAGDSIDSVTVTGSQTDVGSSDNVPSAAVIKNASNENVTANYNITYANGTLEVTAKEITVSGITAEDKTYDGTTGATLVYTGVTLTGIVEGDTLTVSATGAFADADAGAGKTVTISDLALGGTAASNYVLAASGQQTETTADIARADLTLTVTLDDWNAGATANTPEVTVMFGDTDKTTELDAYVTYAYYTDSSCTTPTFACEANEGERPTEAGTYYVKATLAESTNFNEATDDDEFEIVEVVSVTFDLNKPAAAAAEDVVEDTMAKQTLTGVSGEKLNANAFVITGYAFTGWATAADGTGTPYTDENATASITESITLYAQWNKLNTFTNSATFSNPSYIYRVGNSNPVTLGAIFAREQTRSSTVAGDVVSNNVIITVTPNADSNVGDSPTYTKDTSDWTQSTLRFSGTGPITITIQEGETGKPFTMDLEIVAGKNVTEYSELTSSSCVLLNDITMSSGGKRSFSNATLYGNGFTFDVTKGAHGDTTNGSDSSNYVISLSNANLDNVKIIGSVYTTYGGTSKTDYNYPCVLVNGGTNRIVNSYISNCASPVRARGDANVYFENTVLKGGCLCNLDIRGGVHVTINGLTTINQVRSNDAAGDRVMVGLGILVYYEGTSGSESITILNNSLTQYNAIAENQSGNAVSIGSGFASANPVNQIFSTADSKFIYTENNVRWVNAGILSLTGSVGSNNITTPNSNYDWQTGISMFGYTGNLCTKLAVNVAPQSDAPTYSATAQDAVAPNASFEYPDAANKKNYQAKTDGSNDYCYWDASTSTIQIGFDEGASRDFDLNILTVTKNGNSITPTVSVDGGAYQSVSYSTNINTAGSHTLTYQYIDPYNYRLNNNGEVEAYSETYTKTVKITVTTAKASIKPATFAFGSNGSKSVVGTNNITYVMPNVNATSTASIGSRTAGGKTVYYPMVYVKYNSSNNASSVSSTDATTSVSKQSYNVAYCPIFDGVVTITDYDDNNNSLTYGSSTTTLPAGLTFVSDISTGSSFLSWSNGGTPPDNNPVTVSNMLYLQSLRIQGVNRDQTNYVCEYSYTDNAGNNYHYFVGYIFPAKGTGVQMVSHAGETFTVTVKAGSNGSVSGTTTITGVPYGATPTTNTSDSSATYKVNNKTATATPDEGYKFSSWTNGDKRVTGDLTVTANFTSSSSGGGGGGNCVPSGTMVTLANGTQKPVEEITTDDQILVFNHETGTYDTAGIIFTEADGINTYPVVNLAFSDGSVTRLIYEHGYFDLDLMRYVYIHENDCTNYIGHRFAKVSGDGIQSVTLTNAWVTEEMTGCFEFPSIYHLNFIADGFLSMPGGITGMFNFFDYDATLKYDEAKKAADIETYGLLDYSFFEDWMTYDEYLCYPAQYIAVSLGKGLMTEEWLQYLIERYVADKR